MDSQAAVDLAFRDLEFLLASTDDRPVPNYDGRCRNKACTGNGYMEFGTNCSSDAGVRVCSECGIVEPGPIIFEQMCGRGRLSDAFGNYKRKHHFHERISQFLLLESPIPDQQMLRIAQSLCDGTHTVLNKETIRKVLRSLKLQLYIEKWLQIIFRITGIQPPCPGPLVIMQLDKLFDDLQRPFEAQKPLGRKNFLNYNYTFNQLFQKLGCAQFCMFFPMIKSKTKLRTLDETWRKMVETISWPAPCLQDVAPFAVRLDARTISPRSANRLFNRGCAVSRDPANRIPNVGSSPPRRRDA